MILTDDSKKFHRNLDLAVHDNSTMAVWIDWEYGGKEWICTRTIDEMGHMDRITRIPCKGYSPSQVESVTQGNGNQTLFWTGYENKCGKLFWSFQGNDPELVQIVKESDCGDFSAVTDNSERIWLAVQIRQNRSDTVRLLCFDGSSWNEIGLPRQTSLCSRPALALSSDGTLMIAWDEYDNTCFRIGSARLREGKIRYHEPVREKGHWASLPSLACDANGMFYLAYCLERLVDVGQGTAGYHSRIMTAELDRNTGKWKPVGSSCIDYAMNPWMAAYAGFRRFSKLIPELEGGAWTFFEEKIDPSKMNPCPGRLVMRSVDSDKEHILLEGHNRYTIAPMLLDNGTLPVATRTQECQYQQRMPYHVHFCDPYKPLKNRPDNLADNSDAGVFHIHETVSDMRPVEGKHKLFFGDPHLHSSFSMDLDGEQDELYCFARDVAKLDFAVFTDNDVTTFTEPLAPDQWQKIQRNAEFFNRPGEFTALLGWEYTKQGNPSLGDSLNSHRCVLFPGAEGEIYSSYENQVPNPQVLAQRFRGKQVLLHHHHAGDLDLTDESVERNIEIVSGWKSAMSDSQEFKERVHDLLTSGFRTGFIGASDNHERNPGLGGALTGVWARSNTREDIFEALRAGRCFATTGLRPDLRFDVSGAFMGDETEVDSPPLINIDVTCSTPIKTVEIIRDGICIRASEHDNNKVHQEHIDRDCPAGSHYYYVHVLFEGTQEALPWNLAPAYGIHAWSSPVWVVYARPRAQP